MRTTRAGHLEDKIAPERLHGALVARDIARLAAIAALCGGALAIGDIVTNRTLSGWLDWSVALALLGVGWLSFQCSRLLILRLRHSIEKPSRQRNFLELFGYLVLSLTALVFVAFASTTPGWLGQNTIHLSIGADHVAPTPVHLTIFLIAFGLCFVPLLIGFYLQAREETRARSAPLLRDDVVPPISLLIASLVIAGIVLLAWAAEGRLFSMSDDFGVIITLVVICAFLAMILAPHVARFWNNRNESRLALMEGVAKASFPFISPAKTLSRADSILVRLIAPLSGATQRGPGVPHALLIAVLLPLSALGFVLASPFGLIPIAVAMIIALSLGRRWAWVEEDRETASRLQSTRSNEIQIGFDNDLKDEALLGYAWFFILVPLALNQLQDWTHSFKVVASATTGNSFWDWLRFFGSELAKAVPVVDWWEVYNVPVNTPFDARSAEPLAKHLTFAARALVDLVIMSALLQALAMWQRARTQNRLYDSGQLDFFDPFTEAAFFETGMQSRGKKVEPKHRFSARVEKHVKHQQALGLPALPYSQRRLSELIRSDNSDLRAGAEWMIEKFGILAGPPKAQLAQLYQRWLNLRLPQLAAADTLESRARIRAEKLEFERVVSAVGLEAASLSDDDIGLMLTIFEETKGAPEFVYGQVLAYEVLGTLRTLFAVQVLAVHVLEHDRHLDARPTWREDLKERMGFRLPNLFLPTAEARTRIYEALRAIGKNTKAEKVARLKSLELLRWMGALDCPDALADRAAPLRVRAATYAKEVETTLR